MTQDTLADGGEEQSDPSEEGETYTVLPAEEVLERPDYNQGKQDAISAGAKVRGKAKVGEGTYDHAELVIEGRGATAADATRDFEEALEAAEEADWAARLQALSGEVEDE